MIVGIKLKMIVGGKYIFTRDVCNFCSILIFFSVILIEVIFKDMLHAKKIPNFELCFCKCIDNGVKICKYTL